ncbi:hypothetical protein TWF730_007479 [Orbilia blumenaviensis]|uniref:Uncharacterized protein n=1 Tax=Orbilia blumenaviensis TaxID=1796055 RepID=A0AAV9VAM5_9PEZI
MSSSANKHGITYAFKNGRETGISEKNLAPSQDVNERELTASGPSEPDVQGCDNDEVDYHPCDMYDDEEYDEDGELYIENYEDDDGGFDDGCDDRGEYEYGGYYGCGYGGPNYHDYGDSDDDAEIWWGFGCNEEEGDDDYYDDGME